MLTKLISCLPIQLEKIPLVKKTEMMEPDKVTIYLEEVRWKRQGTAHSSTSNCSTLHWDPRRSEIQSSRLVKQAKILAKEGGRTWKDRERHVWCRGNEVGRWLWDGQCISAHFYSSLQLGKTSLKLNISVQQDVAVQNLKAATVYVYDCYKPGEISLT